MVTGFDPNLEKDKEEAAAKAAGQPGAPGAPSAPASAAPAKPVTLGATPTNINTGAGSEASSSGSSPAATNSGRFVNIQNYMNANKPKDAQSSMAGMIGQKLEEQKTQNQQKLQETTQNFQQQAQGNKIEYKPEVVNKVLADPTAYAKPEVATPTAAPTQQQSEYQQFEQIKSGDYKGPKELEDYGALKQQTENFQDLTKQGATEQGRFNLLRNMFNKQGYSRGQQTLDNLLIQSDQGQMRSLAADRSKAAELKRQLEASQRDAVQTGMQLGDQARSARNQFIDQFGNVVSNIDTSIAQRASQAQRERDDLIASMETLYKKGVISAKDLEQFKLDNQMDIYNVDPSKYLKPSELKASRQNVASAEEYARLKALEQLGAGASKEETLAKILQYGDATQAEAFLKDPSYSFQTDKFKEAVADAKGQYDMQRAPIEAMIKEQSGWREHFAKRAGDYKKQLVAKMIEQLQPELAAQYFMTPEMGMYGMDPMTAAYYAAGGVNPYTTAPTTEQLYKNMDPALYSFLKTNNIDPASYFKGLKNPFAGQEYENARISGAGTDAYTKAQEAAYKQAWSKYLNDVTGAVNKTDDLSFLSNMNDYGVRNAPVTVYDGWGIPASGYGKYLSEAITNHTKNVNEGNKNFSRLQAAFQVGRKINGTDGSANYDPETGAPAVYQTIIDPATGREIRLQPATIKKDYSPLISYRPNPTSTEPNPFTAAEGEIQVRG